MRIVWISNAVLLDRGGMIDSLNATARYRMLLPARELEKLGHRVDEFNPRSGMQFAARALQDADAVVFSKPLVDERGAFDPALQAYGELLKRTAAAGRRAILDVNDDHFDVPAFRDFYAAQTPSAWVASTPEMAAALAEAVAGAAPAVIPDPYEGPAGVANPPLPTRFPTLFRLLDRVTARRTGRWRASLLWFGHPASFPELQRALPELEEIGKRFPLHLQCMTSPRFGVEDACRAQNAKGVDSLTMSFAPWSSGETWRALRACDLVLLPAAHGTRKARAKSANRLIEAIRAGRFAVCHPLPAYQALGAYARIGESLAEGIAWALDHPAEVVQRLRAGQQHVEERFSPGAVAQAWLRVLNTPA